MEDIPKLFTAFAEWSACLVFVLILRRRHPVRKTAVVLAGTLFLISILQICIGIWPVTVWIPAMLLAMILMYGCIYICCEVNLQDAGLCWAMAFLSAEFVASFEWQMYTFAENIISSKLAGTERLAALCLANGQILKYGCMIAFYVVFFGVFYLLEKKFVPEQKKFQITSKELTGCFIMTMAVFLMSNVSYVFPDTPFSTEFKSELFYIRTLVDFSGVLILFTQQSRFTENLLKTELTTMSLLMDRQFEQYQLSKSNIEVLNRKYHDLKHQIRVIRTENDEEKREEYLRDLELEIKFYEAQNKTGNKVLDTILTGKSMYCAQQNIEFTCVANGNLLDFMNVMDICSIFGNALDNAIESSEKVKDPSKRIIRVAVYEQGQFVMIRFENYFEEEPKSEEQNGLYLPVTTKQNKAYHGFGLKSIRAAAERYGGTIAVETDANWFYLRILIPRAVVEKKNNEDDLPRNK